MVDGGSTDRTGDIARSVLSRSTVGRWAVVDNRDGTTPSNLNRGLASIEAPVVCRVDARSLIPPDYVRRCAETLEDRSEVAVVGGAQVAVARSTSAVDLGIARALNNRFGMGLARYRRGAATGPSDTVYLGAFRVAELRDAGGWDERFTTNQDFELNRRMAARGLVWFDAALQVGYLPRESLRDLVSQYHRFGRWKVRYWRTTGERPRARQITMLAAPLCGVPIATSVARLRGGWRWLPAGAGAAAVAYVEVRGPSGPEAGVGGHVVSAAATITVGAGWWSGVVRELLKGSTQR